MAEPKVGKHKVHCFMCGEVYSEVTHKGGKQRLKIGISEDKMRESIEDFKKFQIETLKEIRKELT